MNIQSLPPLSLNNFTQKELEDYFDNSWILYEILMRSVKDDALYKRPDPLRNQLVFYLGHTAAFYINKLKIVGIIQESVDARLDTLFAVGVDPDSANELDADIIWPEIPETWIYRKKVYDKIKSLIIDGIFKAPVTTTDASWALLMSIEHERLHFETSSVLIRQLDIEDVIKPTSWSYALSNISKIDNPFVRVEASKVILGKDESDDTFGWDNEYGRLEAHIDAFEATRNLITNREYMEFVLDGAYDKDELWSTEAKKFKGSCPKFWVKNGSTYLYRAMFDLIEMPMDWPVEVTYHEALAYCKWLGSAYYIMSETEFKLIEETGIFNINFVHGSPSPVGFYPGETFNDARGNVWQWISDQFYPLEGFKEHPIYEDFSLPYFDDKHNMLLGGSWATIGAATSKYYRLWFRRNFIQHAGFRVARKV